MSGHLFGVGVGPGDPELLTRKAVRLIHQAQVVAYPTTRRGRGNAYAVVAAELRPDQIELPLVYPVTVETVERGEEYERLLSAFYDEAAARIAEHLEAGRDVAVLCEGDPFFYGSFMYLHDRLAQRFPTEVVPGITSIAAASARLGVPLVRRDAPLTVLPATLSEDELAARLAHGQAFAFMKVGRNFPKVRAALHRAGLDERARYIERATMREERILPFADVEPTRVPYFSVVLVPAQRTIAHDDAPAPQAGRVHVVGLGPGAEEWVSPEVSRALREATDLVGYAPYLDRVPPRSGQRRHASDNRVEIERARHALSLAQEGARVCVVSSGDPGIFAMAAAVMEAIEHGPAVWRTLDVRVAPGISAMQAAAARAGAPLGHDFCAISLSDRLKPWATIAHRLEAAAAADFALAIYNPVSSQRRRIDEARAILLRHRSPSTPVVLARDLGGANERVRVVELGSIPADEIDMRTILLIGSSTTRSVPRPDGGVFVYTPRTYEPHADARAG